MKYVCLGYFDEKKWETMSESEQNAFMDECFAYDEELRKNGHIVGGEALQNARNAVTLRRQDGKVSVTDGPEFTPESICDATKSTELPFVARFATPKGSPAETLASTVETRKCRPKADVNPEVV
jgi:hypothetical protein